MAAWLTQRSAACVSYVGMFFIVPTTTAGEASVVTEFQRNAPAWKAAEPRFVGYAFDYWWYGLGDSHTGCNVSDANPTAPRELSLHGGLLTVTARNASGVNVCPFIDVTSFERTSDVFVDNGGEVTFQFEPPISAFYTNYGSLAVGETCTMRLFSGGALIDSITSAASTHSGAAAGHGFSSPVLIDEIRFTCTEAGTVLIGAFRGTLASQDALGEVCALPCPVPMDFAVVFEGNQITVGLPALDDTEDEVILIPRGRSIYALLVSGYAQNRNFNLLHFFNFAHYVLKQGGYVHYAWWNNLLSPYMGRPLHDFMSFPGDLLTETGGFAPIPGPAGYFSDKARPEEDYQFQADARRWRSLRFSSPPTKLWVPLAINAAIMVIRHWLRLRLHQNPARLSPLASTLQIGACVFRKKDRDA